MVRTERLQYIFLDLNLDLARISKCHTSFIPRPFYSRAHCEGSGDKDDVQHARSSAGSRPSGGHLPDCIFT